MPDGCAKPFIFLFAMVVASCGTSAQPSSDSTVLESVDARADVSFRDASRDVFVDTRDTQIRTLTDPFEAQPDTSEGLTNVSADLAALLENGSLSQACMRYRQDPTARNRLLCGKSMFFYEGFGTAGVPRTLFEWFPEHLPNTVGTAFTRLGMVADPNSTQRYPLGVTQGRNDARNQTLAFTCASCHFGRMPDGRYAVGYPNSNFDYGKLILTLMVAPTAALGTSQFLPGQASAMARARLSDVLAEIAQGGSAARNSLLLTLGGIVLGGSRPITFREADQDAYASWRTGTMDFFMAPTALDDGVHVVSKIAPLWAIPSPTELAELGMDRGWLGSAGSARSLTSFCEGFVALGGGDTAAWPSSALTPLVDYIHSLRAPTPVTPPDVELATRGRELFSQRGCSDCHNGPRGGGTRMFNFEEVGVDDALSRWVDPTRSGASCCGINFPSGDGPTGQIRAPRLVGMQALNRFLYNGSVDSLEALFCLDAERPQMQTPAFSDRGHRQTCDGLEQDEKRALIAFLRSQ